MLLNRICPEHKSSHANDAEKQDFPSTSDTRERHCPLRPLRIKKKTLDSNYYPGHVDEANERDLHGTSDVREGSAHSRTDRICTSPEQTH